MKKRILFIFGTRPEAIKLASVIWELRRHGDLFEAVVCVIAQATGISFAVEDLLTGPCAE